VRLFLGLAPDLAVPLGPDRDDEVDGEDKATKGQKRPEDSLRPVTAVLGDVAQAVEGARQGSTVLQINGLSPSY
jgi:hypothetical protein